MADENLMVEHSMAELREITGYAVACAEPALAIFERDCTDDPRPIAERLLRPPRAPGGDGGFSAF